MVGLGNTKQKIQTMIDQVEKAYAKMNEVRDDVEKLRQRVEHTSDQVDTVSHELAEQRAVVEALAEKEGIDVDQVIADAVIEDAEGSDDGGDAASQAAGDGATDETSASND
jgi:archaellum component FlaC